MNRHSLAFVLALSLLSSVFAQPPQQPSSPNTSAQQDEEVVKITTNLVQVDAVVTDRSGKVVTDLKPEEFQIFEDGRAQPITNFSFVATGANAPPAAANRTTTAAAATKPKRGEASVPLPPARLRPGQVRRTVALVQEGWRLPVASRRQRRGERARRLCQPVYRSASFGAESPDVVRHLRGE